MDKTPVKAATLPSGMLAGAPMPDANVAIAVEERATVAAPRPRDDLDD